MLFPMRTLMYVPGNKKAMMPKAAGYGADIVVLDLEDGVPASEKAVARETIVETLLSGELKDARVIVRINGLGSSECYLDLQAVVARGVLGLRVPKVESAAEIRELDAVVTHLELSVGLPEGGIAFLPILESPLGVVRAFEIATASPRVKALTVGAEDLTVGLGTERSREGLELQYARGHVVMCAAAAGIAAIDTVYSNIQDEEGLIDETRRIKQMGFAGKSVVHPRQIAPIHEVFTPKPEEVEKARRTVEAFERAEAEGIGAISVDGKMVDLPVVARARRILTNATGA